MGNYVHSLRFFYGARSYARFDSTVRSYVRTSFMEPMPTGTPKQA